MTCLKVKGVDSSQMAGRRDFIITETTGVQDKQLLEELYAYYKQPGAWDITEGAPYALQLIRQSGSHPDPHLSGALAVS